MDQSLIESNTDDYWISQIQAFLIFFTVPHQSWFLLYKCRNGEVIFAPRCFHDVKIVCFRRSDENSALRHMNSCWIFSNLYMPQRNINVVTPFLHTFHVKAFKLFFYFYVFIFYCFAIAFHWYFIGRQYASVTEITVDFSPKTCPK